MAVLVAIRLVNLVLGALMYRFVLLRVRGQVLSEVIATFGIGLAILELFRYLGFVGFEYNLPVFIDGSFVIGGVYVDMQRLLIVVIRRRPDRRACGCLPTTPPSVWPFGASPRTSAPP